MSLQWEHKFSLCYHKLAIIFSTISEFKCTRKNFCVHLKFTVILKYAENVIPDQKSVLDNFVHLNSYYTAEKFTSLMEILLFNLHDICACIQNSDPSLCNMKLVWTLICEIRVKLTTVYINIRHIFLLLFHIEIKKNFYWTSCQKEH